jgi:hypothetical protein
MKITKGTAAPCAAGILGGVLLAGVGSAAFAAWPDEEDSSDVDVKVDIAPVAGGALSLTVDGTESVLIETGSTATSRQFIGTLPNVTVTDTRTHVPAGVYWYVTGQAGNFTGAAGQPSITPDHLGWTPALVTPGNGEVAAGDEVKTSLDESPNNVGLVGQEMLQLALDSAEAKAAAGQWTANAGLVLKTDVNVAPGSYTSLLTLSLFEDAF